MKVLFVCLGNICRSPTAEAVLKSIVPNEDLDSFEIDSCGTGGGSSNWYQPGGFAFHEGESADRRMKAVASKRGIRLTSRARSLTPKDLKHFDMIVAMDNSNVQDIMTAAAAWGDEYKSLAKKKTSLMTSYCKNHPNVAQVPDPYYHNGFDTVLDLLLDACDGLLKTVSSRNCST